MADSVSVYDKLAGAVGSNPRFSLALIIALTIVAVGLCVWYRGLFFLGPYASAKPPAGKKKTFESKDTAVDPTLLKLVNDINTGGKPRRQGKRPPPPPPDAGSSSEEYRESDDE